MPEIDTGRQYNPGEFILLTAGEYDYYGVGPMFRVLKPFYLPDVIDKFMEAESAKGRRDERPGDEETMGAFIDHIVAGGLAEAADYRELHLCNYGDVRIGHYCRHPKRSFHLFGDFPDLERAAYGYMMQQCDDCLEQWLDTRRPATVEEYLALCKYSRDQLTGLPLNDEERRAEGALLGPDGDGKSKCSHEDRSFRLKFGGLVKRERGWEHTYLIEEQCNRCFEWFPETSRNISTEEFERIDKQCGAVSPFSLKWHLKDGAA